MATRNERIAAHISNAIIKNTRKRWPGLHQDALSAIEKEIMSEHQMQHPKTDAQIASEKHAEQTALLNRIAELEQRVAKLEAK